jgi:uncharacterized protein
MNAGNSHRIVRPPARLARNFSLSLFLATLFASSIGPRTAFADWKYSPLPSQAAVADGKARRGVVTEARTAYLRDHFTKYEYRIPMRDGVKLFTAVYVPNDASPARRYPFLLLRTPYSVAPYGVARYPTGLGPFESYEHEGFIFVFQDVRGAYMSEGQFSNMRPQKLEHRGASDTDESTDCYDTIAWLLSHVENNNGRAGMWGISYPGFYAAAGAINSHPALKAVSPQAPIADWFLGDDMHRHGAFALEMAFDFFAKFGLPRPKPSDDEDWEPLDHGTPDTYGYYLNLGPLAAARSRFSDKVAFWEEIVAHPNYDEFWQSRNLLPHLRGIRAAILTVGGWYDSEDLYGPLNIAAAIKKQNPGVKHTLLIGPWFHGAWSRTDGAGLGDADFGMRSSELYAEKELGFFLHHLKGGKNPELPAALVFETGANRWRAFSAWPPQNAQPRSIYFQSGSRLSFTQAGSGADGGFDEYLSDPNKPVPCSSDGISGCIRRWAAEDQRFATSRPDVLTYVTEPLENDLTLAGPIDADLWISTTGSDADFVVKVIDVNPDRMPGPKRKSDDKGPDRGALQILVRGEPMRARFRDSYSKPQPLVPNQVTRVRFTINDVFHTFARKHRLMVQVQSSWFPFIDRNPQTFVPSIYQARPTDFIKAMHRLHRVAPYASNLVVRVLPQ